MKHRIYILLTLVLLCGTVAGSGSLSFRAEPTKRTGYHLVTSEPFTNPIRRSGGYSGNFSPIVRGNSYGRTNCDYRVTGNSAVTVIDRRPVSRSMVASEMFCEPIDGRMSVARDDNGNSQGPSVFGRGQIGDMIPLDRNGYELGPNFFKDDPPAPLGDAVMPLLLLVGLFVVIKRFIVK